MIAQTLTILVLATVASAASVPTKDLGLDIIQGWKPYEGVDPNTLSCDPAGLVFLLLPHFEDCNKYYMCTNGKEREYSCPSDLIFDFELQNCNWKWATKCFLRDPKGEEGSGDFDEDRIGMFGEEVENGPIAILTAESSGTVRPTSASLSSAPVSQHFNNILNCNRADSASRQVPYKNDCQRYWKCVSGVPQALYCSDGLFFNENKQQCDFEANAKCAIDIDDELKGEFFVYE